MRSPTTTTTVLLDRLRDPEDGHVWSMFDERYRPLIEGVARRLGLSAEDAAEVGQATIVDFLTSYRGGRYDRGKGRLRTWILAIARHRIADVHRLRHRVGPTSGHKIAQEIADDASLEVMWAREEERLICDRALLEIRTHGRMDARTLAVYDMVAIAGVPAPDVARQFALPVDDVYRIKNRVTGALRRIVAELSSAYTQDG